MPRPAPSFDTSKFINVAQVGGIDAYTIDEGPARGVRALLINTGGGLRYRILVDRGMDIDQAFVGPHSLSFLTHRNVTPPTRAFDRGLDWLKGFPGGLLVSCGPFNIGGPGNDQDGEFGLHGEHSSTAACIESVVQPDPHANSREMSVIARIRNSRLPLAVSITYTVKDFPRCASWQHWGKFEYVAALEPSTGSVEGRDKVRSRGLLGTLRAGEKKIYRYMRDAIGDRESVEA